MNAASPAVKTTTVSPSDPEPALTWVRPPSWPYGAVEAFELISLSPSLAEQYTKDLMVEETYSPILSFSSSPVSSPALSGGGVRPPALAVSPAASSPPLPSHSKVPSATALLSVPSEDDEPKQRASLAAPPRQVKRRRSISDSLVPVVNKKITGDADVEDELDAEEELSVGASDAHPSQGLSADAEDDSSEDIEESGEEGDDDQPAPRDVGSSPRARQGGVQGHESGPPSPPAEHYQHGSTM